MNGSPRNAADFRPGNQPYFIASNCPTCEAALVLIDRDQPASEVWHDEWECPRCDNGVYLDWPESAIEALRAASRKGPCVPLEQLRDTLQSSDDLLG
jgi:Zn-finger nucleic acid-binding protein